MIDRGALDDVRVLDATQMLAGPLAGARLGDLGADVIKLEAPGTGEFNRQHGFNDRRVGGEMTTFLAVNRNKRSLAVDIKSVAGRQIVLDLAASSDVFIQNFRHGTADRLGIGYAQLKSINPRLVYCSISGYGSTGPYRDRPGQDLVLQGYSGSMFSVGRAEDPPTPGALWAADVMTGYQAVIGILAGLHARATSGQGQHVEIDMFSVVLDAQLQELVTFLNAGEQPTRDDAPSAHASIPAPYGIYRTSDGWMTLAMCPLPALGVVVEDDWLIRRTGPSDGFVHREEIYRRLESAFVGRRTKEWLEICDANGVWAGPVYDYSALAADEHVRATRMFTSQELKGFGDVRTVQVPIHMSQTPPSIRRGAPRLGEHTVELLTELGVSPKLIDQFLESGVVAGTSPMGVEQR